MCNVHTRASVGARDVAAPPLVIFYERYANRYVANADELCVALSRHFRVRLVVEPPDMCSMLTVMHSADIIVTHFGGQARRERRGGRWCISVFDFSVGLSNRH
jgi:hypothetical protein